MIKLQFGLTISPLAVDSEVTVDFLTSTEQIHIYWPVFNISSEDLFTYKSS